MPERVMISGYEVATPFGIGIDRNWDRLVAGESCLKRIERFDCSGRKSIIAGEISLENLKAEFPSSSLRKADPAIQLSIITIDRILKKQKLTQSELSETGLITGTGYGTQQSTEKVYTDYYLYNKTHPLTVPRTMNNSISSEPAIVFGLNGINLTVFTACSSALNAIGQAYLMVKHGVCDRIIAGGVDTCLTSGVHLAWNKLKILSKNNEFPGRASCPFSKNRDGLVLSEGAGFVLLESKAAAEKRGAAIYAELAGFGSTCDAKYMTMPDLEQQAKAMNLAIKDAAITPRDVSYINAHGTSMQLGDRVETESIIKVFQEDAKNIPVSSNKSQLGHTMGAAGAIELALTLKMIRENLLLPTINYERDPELDLNYIPNQPLRPKSLKYVLKNSFGFGGSNASVVLRNTDKEPDIN